MRTHSKREWDFGKKGQRGGVIRSPFPKRARGDSVLAADPLGRIHLFPWKQRAAFPGWPFLPPLHPGPWSTGARRRRAPASEGPWTSRRNVLITRMVIFSGAKDIYGTRKCSSGPLQYRRRQQRLGGSREGAD
ncbi:hypothetical protein MRX96_029242 [Rhipicephalus microplus]